MPGKRGKQPEEGRERSAENQEPSMSDSAERALAKLRELMRMHDQTNRDIHEFDRIWQRLRPGSEPPR
jgi:hypothetical protein